MPNGYVLLDDFASFVSHSAREKANAFLDAIVRLSYSRSMPFMVITAEEQALGRITPFCRERLLEIPVNDVFKEKNLTAILDYLSNNKDSLDEIFKELESGYCPYDNVRPQSGYYYAPKDLILCNEPKSAILIENPKYIYQYPDYCDTVTPLMIVRSDALLTLMNSELHKFCTKYGIHLQPFDPKGLQKQMFELNMYMYNYISKKHKIYTFKYASWQETSMDFQFFIGQIG